MSRLIKLEIENVKGVRAVRINPKGGVVVLKGKNKAGKSSVIDSIEYLFGGKSTHPPKVIREGAERASVLGETEDFIATRRWKRNAEGAEITEVEVVAKEGGKVKSPQALLDKLYNDTAFHPDDFLRWKGEKQTEILQTLTGVNTKAIEGERDRVFTERTGTGRDLKSAKARLAALAALPSAKPVPADVPALLKERGELTNAQQWGAQLVSERNAATRRYADCEAHVKTCEAALNAARARLEEAQKQLAQADNAVDDAEEKVAGIPEKLAALDTRLKEAQASASALAQWEMREKLKQEVEGLEAKQTAETSTIEALEKQREETIAAAKFPVPGLGFGPTGITLDGLPFEQASQAQRLRVSVAIAVALNPKLRVMLVREGSFFDEEALALLEQLCEEHDCQCWVEMVRTDWPATVRIVDGEVAS